MKLYSLVSGVVIAAAGTAAHAAFVCSPMSGGNNNSQLAGHWRIIVPHQQLANNEVQTTNLILSVNGQITASSGDGTPVTGNIVVHNNCTVTGTIVGKYKGSAKTYTLSGMTARVTATSPSVISLVATSAPSFKTVFTLVQTP